MSELMLLAALQGQISVLLIQSFVILADRLMDLADKD